MRMLARRKGDYVLGYPGLKSLSEKRAESVRGYLAEQGIPGSSMTAVGFGRTQPIASNDTAAGRHQNRRVELVVSGEVIGTTIGELRMQPTSLSQSR
jgi:hypothetical protein